MHLFSNIWLSCVMCDVVHATQTFMSIFYIALPCGAALGYGVSGLLAARISWRVPFFAEGIIMLFLSIMCLMIPSNEKYREYQAALARESASIGGGGVSESEDIAIVLEKTKASMMNSEETLGLLEGDTESTVSAIGMTREEVIQMKSDRKYNILQAIYALGTNPSYVFAALAATAYTFVVGGLAFWAPTVVSDLLNWSPERANLAFSAVCAVTGLFGSFFGGILLDFIGGAVGMRGASRAFVLCTIYIGIALPLGTAAFFMRNAYLFFAFLFVAELFVVCIMCYRSRFCLTFLCVIL